MSRTVTLSAFAVTAVLACAAAGYAIGSSSAPDASEARAAELGAERRAFRAAFTKAQDRAALAGERKGRAEGEDAGERDGAAAGARAGDADAEDTLASLEPEPATPTTSGLTYTPQLPNGEPGYVLPEDQRSLACVGIDAATGECVGD